MPQDLKEILRDYAKRMDHDLFILFGSRASGKATLKSDLDVAYVGNQTPLEVTNDLVQLTHINRIDVIHLQRCSPVIGMQILKKGEVLFRVPDALGKVNSLISRRYADTKKFRKAVHRQIEKFVEDRVKS